MVQTRRVGVPAGARLHRQSPRPVAPGCGPGGRGVRVPSLTPHEQERRPSRRAHDRARRGGARARNEPGSRRTHETASTSGSRSWRRWRRFLPLRWQQVVIVDLAKAGRCRRNAFPRRHGPRGARSWPAGSTQPAKRLIERKLQVPGTPNRRPGRSRSWTWEIPAGQPAATLTSPLRRLSPWRSGHDQVAALASRSVQRHRRWRGARVPGQRSPTHAAPPTRSVTSWTPSAGSEGSRRRRV